MGNYPVVCVDWCDAYAYCAGIGKRLCGKIGGGALAFSAFADATMSQWYAICTSNGQFTYPYGNTYNKTACNGHTSGGSTIVSVGSFSACYGADPMTANVYDMSGNVGEWEDSCRTSDNACRLRGGTAFDATALALSCATDAFAVRTYTDAATGIRCCSSP
jgi:formylglycine-generating enzyme required for sulfatase activity